VKQIEAIRFAVDWLAKGRECGGKKFKGKFAQTVYEAQTGRLLPNSTQATIEDKKIFKAFRSQHQVIVTAWRLLLSLYIDVC
jgi:hypothetical protein